MLRGENIACGTTTTGTGALTLAACPSTVGGIDPYVAFSGMGFGTSVPIPIRYVIAEDTDATFATPKQVEVGVGTLTLGASIGACVLTRTTPQVTQIISGAGSPSYNFNAPSPISIGNAANTLVMIAPAAADSIALVPYWNTANGDNMGIPPLSTGANTSNTGTLGAGTEYFIPFILPVPLLAKRASVRVAAAYTGGTSNVYLRLYDIGSNGFPGKLLADFGVAGTAGASLGTAGNISTAALTTAPFLIPGGYYMSVYTPYSGGSGSPTLHCLTNWVMPPMPSGFASPWLYFTATNGTAVAPDPAAPTGVSGIVNSNPPMFYLNNQ